jgi:TonB family protein
MPWHSFVGRAIRGAMVACVACLVAPFGALGQTSTPQAPTAKALPPQALPPQALTPQALTPQALTPQAASSDKEDQVPVDLYREPSAKRIDQPDCEQHLSRDRGSEACELLIEGTEGWVELGFMVDPSGRPFEITVIRSTGIKAFEKMAVSSIEHSTFVPGTLDGKPIESGFEMKYNFVDPYLSAGARSDFIKVYKEVQQSIAAGDRTAADAAMNKLKITNFYEDAYFGVAKYFYAKEWGDESDELTGLRRAIAYEGGPKFLPRTVFEALLLNCLNLETKLHQYAEALETARTLQKNKLDKVTAAQVATVMEQLQKLRSDGGAYEVPGSMPDGSWHLHLFKQHFQAEVTEGYISQVKLRCPTRYVSFAFDPKLQYTVSNRYGNCSIELDGAPGTKFKLVQF